VAEGERDAEQADADLREAGGDHRAAAANEGELEGADRLGAYLRACMLRSSKCTFDRPFDAACLPLLRQARLLGRGPMGAARAFSLAIA
jgi:hypothetical protein